MPSLIFTPGNPFIFHLKREPFILLSLFSRFSLSSSLKKLAALSSMASEADVSELSSRFERLVRNRDLSLFLPFIFGFANNLQRREEADDHENDNNRPNDDNNNRVILINPFTQGMVVIDGVSSLDTLFRELGNMEGQPPASKESVKALPSVAIGEDCREEECVVCLEEFGVGGLAKEMPCKHRFHGECIEKWLGIHGSCPVCRHKMPADEQGDEKKRRPGEREIWVSFSFNAHRSSDEPNQTSSTDSGAAEGGDSSPDVQG